MTKTSSGLLYGLFKSVLDRNRPNNIHHVQHVLRIRRKYSAIYKHHGTLPITAMLVARKAGQTAKWARSASTAAAGDKYKVLVVGAGRSILDRLDMNLNISTGSGGLSVANQIYNRFKSAGKSFNHGDVAIVDAAEYHYYQVGQPAFHFLCC